MKFINLLIEGKKERIIDKFRSQLEQLGDEAIQYAEKIIDEDPSTTKKYSEWGIKKLIDTKKDPHYEYQGKSIITITGIIISEIIKYHQIADRLSPEKVRTMFDFNKIHDHFSDKKTEDKINSRPKDINSFTNLNDAISLISHMNSGLGRRKTSTTVIRGINKAKKYANTFNYKEDNTGLV